MISRILSFFHPKPKQDRGVRLADIQAERERRARSHRMVRDLDRQAFEITTEALRRRA